MTTLAIPPDVPRILTQTPDDPNRLPGSNPTSGSSGLEAFGSIPPGIVYRATP